MTTFSRLPVMVAIALCALAINSTLQFHKELTNRIGLQETLIQTRTTWNNQLVAMQPMEAQWKKALPSKSDLLDQANIIRHIDAPSLGLTLPETGLTCADPAPLSYQGQPIGLLRYSVSNQATGLRLTAPDFSTAWQALAALQARPDIRFTRARLENDKGVPTLALESFAVIARAEAE